MELEKTMSAAPKPKVTIILANLGTPDAATTPAVRAFLKQFLSDRRVIEIPALLWQIILRCFVLPFRPKRVTHAYKMIWQKDSPMREILFEQTQKVSALLKPDYPQFELNVVPAMTYGQPGIQPLLQQLAQNPQDHIILLPLFPQYSATSTAPLYDAFAKWIPTQRNLPGLSIVKEYYRHPLFIEALADSVQKFQAEHGKPEKLLMSFHGIPKPYADKGDPYPTQCIETAQRVAQWLGLEDDEWAFSFQSRFGKQEWVKPYTDQILQQWAEQGVNSVQVLSPAFSADCLETLEELALQNADLFKQYGGTSYQYIPALNASAPHIDLLTHLLRANLNTLDATLAH